MALSRPADLLVHSTRAVISLRVAVTFAPFAFAPFTFIAFTFASSTILVALNFAIFGVTRRMREGALLTFAVGTVRACTRCPLAGSSFRFRRKARVWTRIQLICNKMRFLYQIKKERRALARSKDKKCAYALAPKPKYILQCRAG